MANTVPLASKGIVLIVDDTPTNLAVLSDMLSEAHYRVLVATDGLSALEQIEYLKPDIILLDVIMPGIDGFETCHRLKQNLTTANIPIIFMTGLSELDNLLKGFEKGAVDYIVKPIRPAEVIARIEAQLSQNKHLLRAEAALNHMTFAALAFTLSGRVTWITEMAIKVLSELSPKASFQRGELLPESILNQINHKNNEESFSANHSITDIKLTSSFTGKVIPCQQISEFMLLIQNNSQEWDLATIKNTFGLTAREAEILMWISKGKTNKEVGLILDTSPRTVNKHLEHVFEKLNVSTRTAAVAKVLEK